MKLRLRLAYWLVPFILIVFLVVIPPLIMVVAIPAHGVHQSLYLFLPFLLITSIINVVASIVSLNRLVSLTDAQLVSNRVRWLNLEHIQSLYPIAYSTVKEICKKHGIHEPKIGIIDSKISNAFTYGKSPLDYRIIIHNKLLLLLKDEELAAIFAHELGHVINHDSTLMTILSFIYTSLESMGKAAVKSPTVHGGNLAGIAVLAIIIPVLLLTDYVWKLLCSYFSRAREFSADQFSLENVGNSNTLSKALIKIKLFNDIVLAKDSNAQLDGFEEQIDCTKCLGIVDTEKTSSMSLEDIESRDEVEVLIYSESESLLSTHPPVIRRVHNLLSYSSVGDSSIKIVQTEALSDVKEVILKLESSENYSSSIPVSFELMNKLSFLKIRKSRIKKFLALMSILFLITGIATLIDIFHDRTKIYDLNFAIISTLLGGFGVCKVGGALFRNLGYIHLGFSGLLIRHSNFFWEQAEKSFFNWFDIEDIRIHLDGSDEIVVFNLSGSYKNNLSFSELRNDSIKDYDFALDQGYVKKPAEICRILQEWQVSFSELCSL